MISCPWRVVFEIKVRELIAPKGVVGPTQPIEASVKGMQIHRMRLERLVLGSSDSSRDLSLIVHKIGNLL